MPITAPSAPPRGRTRTSSGNPQPSATQVSVTPSPLYGRSKERAEGLQGWMQLGVLGCIAKGWLADAGAIAEHGETVSTEIARAAESAEPLGKVLDFLSMSGPYAALFGALLPFAAQIAMNHKVISSEFALEGTMPPEALEAKVRRDITAIKMQALLAQKQAEEELAQMKAAMNGDMPERQAEHA